MDQGLSFSAVTNNDVTIEVTVRNIVDCELIDLTGYFIEVGVFSPGTKNQILTYTTDDTTVTILNQGTKKGKFQFTILASQSINFAAGIYPWESVLVSVDGSANTIVNKDEFITNGSITFRKELTVQP